MTNPSKDRRSFLRRAVTIVPVSTLAAGATVTQVACSDQQSAPAAKDPAKSYTPTFFTQDEWAFIHKAVALLIPNDDMGPGAVEAGVPEFIDRQMETPYGHGKLWYMQGPFRPESPPELGYQTNMAPRDIYRHGMAACDAWCKQQHGGKGFAALDDDTRLQVLKDMEAGKAKFENMSAKLFFSTLLANTKEGFFADPMYGGNKGMTGWKQIGFPGARADFMDWIDQPNKPYPYGPVSIQGDKA
ncbi:MAG: gluconate 2-dehydrogenase subunit 3 family protein [Acidovorax sp.]